MLRGSAARSETRPLALHPTAKDSHIMKTPALKTMMVATLVLGLGSALIAASTANNQSPQVASPSPNRPPSAPQSPSGASQERTAQNQTPATSVAYEDSRGRPASVLIGRDVVGVNDEKLGQLGDFIVDADSGRIIYSVVSSGGTSSAGGALRAVPFNAFVPELATNGLRMRLNVEEAIWTKAPRFDKHQLGRLSEGSMLQEDIYHHYGLQPPLKIQPGGQRLELVRETIGKQLYRGEQTIGKVEDVIVHLNAQMAAVLFDPRDDFVGTDQKFILPFGSLTKIRNNAFSTTLSLQDFTSAQVSTDATWAMSTGSFSAPYLWPAYGTTATPLANTPPTIQSRGLSASRPPVDEIRQALATDAYTKWYQINVVAAHDRVILQGTVQDEDDKRRVESRASQSAGGWKIDNQLRIVAATGE